MNGTFLAAGLLTALAAVTARAGELWHEAPDGVPGAVLVTSTEAGKTSFECVGYADLAAKRKMTPDTLFAVFSMTKTFTGAALMCAIDEGRISLDDEVAKFLPEFADVKMKDGTRPKRPLTLRDLTSHVSGFRGGYKTVNRDIPLREVARKLAAQPLEFQPGETFAYGNSWICSAAACIEVAVGEPFENYLKRKVLDPLGMVDTTFWPNDEQLKRLVKAYTSDDKPLRPAADNCARQLVFPKEKPLCAAPGGGMFSTPQDIVKFSQMLARKGLGLNGRRILSEKTFDACLATRQTPPVSASVAAHVPFIFTSTRSPASAVPAKTTGWSRWKSM